MILLKILKFFKAINIIKTVYFNLKMFPIKEAIKMPVFIGYHTKFVSLLGKIYIEDNLKSGMIRFGFGTLGIVDEKYTKTLIELNGSIIFKGKANFGHGSKIAVGKEGILCIGKDFHISGNSTIICADSVIFGDDVLVSWEIIIMDTDFHETENTLTNIINHKITKQISIGNNTWIGMRSTLLKGTRIPANTIIGSNSFLNKAYIIDENCLLAGNPANIVKTDIKRHHTHATQ